MPHVIHAIYEDGVFKPLQEVSIRDREEVSLKIVTMDEWQARFAALLARIRARAATRPSEEVEEDIRLTVNEVREERRGR